MSRPSRVLFVCKANSCRSQMAEGLLRETGGADVQVYSAGLVAGGMHPLAVRAMDEIGVPITGQSSKDMSELDEGDFDLVVTLYDKRQESEFSAAQADQRDRKRLLGGVPVLLRWAIDDPVVTAGSKEEAFAAFRRCRDEIRTQISTLLEGGYLGALLGQRNRLHRFANLIDEGILVHDLERNIYLVNDAFLRITGFDREEVLGRDCHEVFAPHGLCGNDCQFCGAASLPEGRQHYDIPIITSDGTKKQVQMTTELLELESGQFGLMAVLRDDTEVRQLRRNLSEKRRFHGMVGTSQVVREVFSAIESVSVSDYPVLVTGESGTGKELVAGAIHNESARRAGPFVPVNCGAIPESIVESELFGHVRGAFTGAIRDKKGRFELADGGTLFLDEVGELPKVIQVKLLRILETKRFSRVGDEREVSVNIRIISATNRDLREMVREGSFREDLFYRLCVVPITLPPLRERREDIPLLIQHALEMTSRETRRPALRVGGPTLDLMSSYDWPGNVRELINSVQFASVRCQEDEIRTEHLPPEIRRRTEQVNENALPGPVRSRSRFKLTPAAVERALEEADGNKAKAARLLNVGRATLYRYLDRQES